jgi:hypothetical protein
VPDFYSASSGSPLEPVTVAVWPEAGQFEPTEAFEQATLQVTYQYGFPGAIGAGPYDRTQLADPPDRIDPEEQIHGGAGLDTALHDAAGAGTVTIADSLTYATVEDVASVSSLLVRGGPSQRPVVRLAAASAWTFTGQAGAELTLDGLFVSGGDIVLQGPFAHVRLTGCTTDPGTLDETGAALAQSVDGRELAPVTIWIEGPGAIRQLTIDHCVLGPVRTRNGGAVEAVSISDSIVQGIDPAGSGLTVFDPQLLQRAVNADNPLSKAVLALLADSSPGGIEASLASVIGGPSIWDSTLFADVPLPVAVQELVAEGAAADTAALNLGLLRAAFPVALASAALAFADGTVALDRVTVLGDAYVHRLDASDSILAGFTVAEDAQDGCVRFSAVGPASRVASPYLSVSLAAGAAVFTSTSFGDPAYGQLLDTADRAIASGAAGATITAGADTGSELGAYSADLAPVKEKGLLIKYAEYMPLGLTPVVVHVT